ncbi:MAG: putative acetyltransferase EpsM [Anaerolineae bacterium]|nr:putative acetyltransferase EpsM [Anaerolineae bacterium]
MKILILGAGGHAQVVADILLARQQAGDPALELAGFLDDDPALHGRTILGRPVLGPISACAALPHEAIIIGIGHNPTRTRLAEQLQAAGEQLITAIHPTAVIGADVAIGPGCVICAGVIVNTGTKIGANVILNTGCTVDHHNIIGPHAHIAPGVHLGGDVNIGPGTLVGIGATILPQQTVGAECTVGAGSVVINSVPDGVTVAGVPARIIRQPHLATEANSLNKEATYG